MNKLICTIILIILSAPFNASSKENFPWELFLPAITKKYECSINHISLCKDQITCDKAGGYWWSKTCNQSMSASQSFIARLAGNVHFTYNFFGIQWNETYYFDINTLRETDSQNGYFEMYGIDEYGIQVRVYEYGIGSSYIFINYGFTGIDERFVFHWEDSSNLSGLIRIKDKSQSSWEDGLYTDLYGTHSN